MSPQPSDPDGTVWAARGPQCLYFRVERLGSMNNAMAFRDLFESMLAKGERRFVLDLKACIGLDSTFIGTLLALQQHVRATPGSEFVVVNLPDHCREALSQVGVTPYLTMGGVVEPPNVQLVALQNRPMVAKERGEMMLAAHEALVRADAANEKRFGPFLEALRKEMNRLSAERTPEEEES